MTTQNVPATALKTFTSQKLDWLDAVMADPRVSSRAFEVAFCIAQHVGQKTGITFISDATISDKTGIPLRWISRARNALKQAGWISWRRTGRSNHYHLLGGNMSSINQQQERLKQARDERRRIRADSRVVPAVAYRDAIVPPLGQSELPPLADGDMPRLADGDVPPMANKHLGPITFEEFTREDWPAWQMNSEGPRQSIRAVNKKNR